MSQLLGRARPVENRAKNKMWHCLGWLSHGWVSGSGEPLRVMPPIYRQHGHSIAAITGSTTDDLTTSSPTYGTAAYRLWKRQHL